MLFFHRNVQLMGKEKIHFKINNIQARKKYKKKNQTKAGPKVIATSTYDESGQNAILDDNVINIDARDTQILAIS